MPEKLHAPDQHKSTADLPSPVHHVAHTYVCMEADVEALRL